MPDISAALLEKFIKGICTEEEAAIVEAYFEQHPDDVYLLDEYEAEEIGEGLPAGYAEEMRETVAAATRPRVLSWVRTMRVGLAAASVVLLAGAWWLLRPVSDRKEVKEQLAAIWVGKHNPGTKKIMVQLPDSSEAILSPGTTIRYRKGFGQTDPREIKVEGQVAFTVIKDKEMPFVVYAENVRTTVLGTIFEVTAEKNSDHIKVRLLEGNLIVHIDSLARDSARKYFLSPGDEFIYGKWNNSVVVQKWGNHIGGGNAASRINRPPTGKDSLSAWYMFNNQSLTEVLDELSVLYNVDIQYSNEDLRNKYFIGRLERKDSLSKIMRDIALLNHLSLTIIDGKYIVRKQKP